MAKSKKKKKAVESEAPPGGEAKPKPKTPTQKQKAVPLDHITPLIITPFPRSTRARDKVIALVGRLVCLITGMWDHPHFLHCAHIVARSLHTTHKSEVIRVLSGRHWNCNYYRDEYGNILRKVLNLDTSVNQEIFHAWIHLLFDGTSVVKNVGQGAIALVPEDLVEIVKAVKENHDNKLNKNYREICPKRTYRYKLRALTNKKYWFGRHAGADRTYAHLSPETRTPEDLAQADREEAVPLGEMKEGVDHASAVFGPEREPTPPEGTPPTVKTTNGDVTFHILDTKAEEITLVSHANPIFVIRDYAQKMRYRIDNETLVDNLPAEEHIAYFQDELWPAVKHWFKRDSGSFVSKEGPTETGHDTRAQRSANPEGPMSAPESSFPPRGAEAQRRANTTAGIIHTTPTSFSEPPSSPSPAENVEQPGLHSAIKSVAASRSARSAKQAVRFDSPGETPSSPGPERQALKTSVAIDADAAPTPGHPSTSESVLDAASGGISLEKVTADAAEQTPFERTAGHEEGTKSVPNADRHIEPRPKRAAKTNPTCTSAPPTVPSVAPPSVAPRPAPAKDPPVRRSTRLNGEQQPVIDSGAVPKAPDKPPVPDASAAPPPAAPTLSVDPPPPLASSVPVISGRRLRSHTKRAHDEVVAAAADNPEGPAEPPEPPDPPEPPRKKARVTKATAVDTAPQPLAKKRRPGKHKGRPTQTNEDT
ncbi:hypothetical protein BD626DRAFT_538296 [Schizophyllum amplum]|uniref:Uncharacterized protein n=1 Tax=Schizophyllum amplum TaxID=97359 RepID=A0A550C999_9AGAR|nr:hypothetical protein BD626DRAFT_538296 [Auriculariopsis ampla]